MQSGRLGRERQPRGSPRPVRHKILIPNGPDPCGRSGARSPVPPQHRRDHVPAAFPGSLSPTHTVTAPCSAAGLAARQACEPPACGIGCTERHCAAPEFTDSRQRRFSTQISTQTGGTAELRGYISWSRPPTGVALQGVLPAFQAGHAGSIPVARSSSIAFFDSLFT